MFHPVLLISMFLFTLTAPHTEESTMLDTASNEESILVEHVHEIFRAFLARDRKRIRELHSDDWVGFLGPSTRIERGIEDYMINADRSLDSFRGTAYEILDTEVQIHGDIALVYYVATYSYEDDTPGGGTHTLGLRSVDVFRREAGDWIQVGSHIGVIPSGGKWGEGE